MRKLRKLAGLAFGAAMLSTAIRPAIAEDMVKIRDGVFPVGLFLVDFSAKASGEFEKNGIDAELIGPATTVATAFQLMTGGQLDLYGADLMTILVGLNQGLDLKVISCAAPSNEYDILGSTALAGKKEASFKERMQALAGKKIGVTGLSTGTDYALTLALRSAGVDPNSVTRIAVGPPSAAIGQFQAHRIDAYVVGAIDGAALIADTVDDAYIYAELGGADAPDNVRSFTQKVWFMPGSKIKSEPATVAKVRAALQSTVSWLIKNPDGAAKVWSSDMLGKPDSPLAGPVTRKMIDQFLAPNESMKCKDSFLAAANASLKLLGLSDRTFKPSEVFAK